MDTPTPIQITPEIQAVIDAKVKEQRLADEAGLKAAAVPFPGPTREAFALNQHIEVGQWKIRPFYDIDIEFLSQLKHPLHDMMQAGMRGDPVQESFTPRGPEAWVLAWILTHPIEDTEKRLLEDGKIEELKRLARAEFSRLQLPAIAQIVTAAITQMKIYYSPVLGYGEAKTNAEGEQSANPPSAESPGKASTVSAGSLTSDAA